MKNSRFIWVMMLVSVLLLGACGGGDSTPTPTSDNTRPVISLLGANPMDIVANTVFTDPGSTVTDNVDTGLSATVTGTVNAGVLGTYTLTYNVSDAAGNAAIAATRTVNVVSFRALNDTGITLWGNATVNNGAVTEVTFPGQDADFGRDAAVATNSNADGKAGFSFTKLDATGTALVDQAVVYTTTPWFCVQDQVTGLMWEVKTGAGLGGLRDANHLYTWFNSTGVNDGGNAGTANGGVCTGSGCDTEKYVAAVNVAGLCGFNDWRLPNREALRSIVDHSVALPGPTIDIAYFPNTQGSLFWSSSPYAALATRAWFVTFTDGSAYALIKSNTYYVRLVRSGQ